MRAALSLGFVLVLTAAMQAQTNVGVELDDVTDNRFPVSKDPNAFVMTGALELRVKLTGKDLEKASAARVIVKEAKDDKGNSLGGSPDPAPDFMGREYNNGTLQFRLNQPARAASSVRLKGTVELYVPARDPNANVKIEKALSKLDTPFSSKALKAAKIEITPLSREGYAAAAKARKITDKDIEQIRAEGKKRGVDEKEIEMAIEMAKAFEGMDGDLPPNAVIFSGKKADFDRIYRIEILGADGTPINVGSRSVSSRGDSSIMTLAPSEAIPATATVQLMLVTDKARVSFPFDLKVELP